MEEIRYPIGTQTFEILRNMNCLYVDKTRYIYDMMSSGSRFYFLSRPRRFGKSLFLSTLNAYFSGKKELFKGLAIYDLETKWEKYPILHFDLSGAEATDIDKLENYVANRLKRYEKEFGLPENFSTLSLGDRFGQLIEDVAEKTGKQVVILIDEYDKGIVEVLDNANRLIENQNVLRPFFTQLKIMDRHIRFAMLTGIARFRHYTLFSGFNNLLDISMDPRYASICGITREELIENFNVGITALAEKHRYSFDEMIRLLKNKYNGYRFTEAESYVFNPFSILNALATGTLGNFWIKSGTSKTFLTYLAKATFKLTDLEDIWCTQEQLEGTFSDDDPMPLLFQSGYMTIKEYDGYVYRLALPNSEVRRTLVEELMPKYMGTESHRMPVIISRLVRAINSADIDSFLTDLQALIASVPYHLIDVRNMERTYHMLIYEACLMMGIEAHCEIAVAGGRIDMTVATARYLYVMEFKLGGSPIRALAQIDDRGYALKWSADGRKVFKVGVVFSPETRTIDTWRVREVKN